MDITIIGLIVLGIFGIVFAVAMIVQTSKAKKTVSKSNQTNIVTKDNKGKDIPKKDMMSFLEFDRIVDDMIMQENENKYTVVVQCKGINYDLMSEVEQLSVEEGFITFLNTLKFPIQLYVQARAIDLKKSMEVFKHNVDNITNDFNTAEDKLKSVASNINSTNKELNEAKLQREKYSNILEYAQDITKYMDRLSLNKHMLQRKFYVVLSYYKSEINAVSEFTNEEIHELCHNELYTRAQTLISALSACSVFGRVLTSNELAELLYISYNRDDEKLLNINTALESGFYRLYSTSEDVYDKKRKLMEKEIQEEASRRVQEAIKEVLDADEIKTPDELVEEFEDGADRAAIKLVNDSDIEDTSKEQLTNIIATKHVVNKNNRRNVRLERDKNEQSERSTKLEDKSNESQDINIKNVAEKVENEKIEDNVQQNSQVTTNDEINIKDIESIKPSIENTLSGEDDSII